MGQGEKSPTLEVVMWMEMTCVLIKSYHLPWLLPFSVCWLDSHLPSPAFLPLRIFLVIEPALFSCPGHKIEKIIPQPLLCKQPSVNECRELGHKYTISLTSNFDTQLCSAVALRIPSGNLLDNAPCHDCLLSSVSLTASIFWYLQINNLYVNPCLIISLWRNPSKDKRELYIWFHSYIF